MTAITNYNDLLTEVRTWLNRPNALPADIGRGVRMVETTVRQRLRSRDNRIELASYVSATEPTVSVPDGFISLIQMVPTGTWDDSSGSRVVSPLAARPIEIMSFQRLRTFRQSSGVPACAAEVPNGLEWELWPVGGQYEITLWYFAVPPALSDSNTTNFLLEANPDLYLSGTLAFMETFYKIPPENRGPWGAMFDGLITSGNRDLSSSQVSGSTLRQRSPYGNS